MERLAPDRRAEKFGAPNLMAREGSTADLVACRALDQSLGVPFSDACWCLLLDIWCDLLANGTMKLFLVEDRARPPRPRIVSFSATLFITDEFCREAQSTLPPYLGAQVVRHYPARALPVLNRKQVAQANAREGLNLMMCFGGLDHDGFSHEQFLAVREKQSEAFHLALNGYRVKEFLADPIGEEAYGWMCDGGFRFRRDYSNYFRKQRVPIPRSPQRPWLVGLTKEEALAHPGSHFGSLFVYTAPRFHFSRSQQRLLRHALVGETCAGLAGSLFISPWTVKKCWHAIYERVADVDRELLPQPIADGPHAASRGAERRRRLLNYLRQHPEELRPFDG